MLVLVRDNKNGLKTEIVGQCPQLLKIYEVIDRTNQTDTTILITGESGTGKELVARAIHFQSSRKNHPFIVINCGAIPENLLESELFGHEKGAFTGAHVHRRGRLELADKGTLFLDEIGEMSAALQVKLLRFLQEKEIERVGGRATINLDVRIITATNQNLEDGVETGTFRTDLYYRLSVISLHLPPLRERGEDVFLLSDYFITKFNKKYGKSIRGFSTQTERVIRDYGWPGNIRELENRIRRAVIMAKQPLITPEDLGIHMNNSNHRRPLKALVGEFEEKCIREALTRNQGIISQTAKDLGINRTTFYDMLNKHQIDHKKYRSTMKGPNATQLTK